MKKYLFLCFVFALFVSCKTTDPAKKYPNMIADVEPFSVGEVNAFIERSFSSRLTRVTMEVVFYPRENEVALEFTHTTGGQYRQFWNEAARQRFIEALNRYKDDFASQSLTTNYKKSRAVYGKVPGRLQWQTLKISSTYKASPAMEIGYRFKDNSPYFTIRQIAAKEETGTNKSGITKSPVYSIYFTRAQAEELTKLFNQAFLLETVVDIAPPPQPDDPIDDYYNQSKQQSADDDDADSGNTNAEPTEPEDDPATEPED